MNMDAKQSPLRFQPRLVPTLATVAGVAVLVYLGQWQAGKGERRAAEIAQHTVRAQRGPTVIGSERVEPAALQDAPVSVRGVFERDGQFYVDNRQEDGKPGVHVVTPLRIAGSDVRILVNRGWAPWVHGRTVLPVVDFPSGEVQVRGVATVPVNKNFFLMPQHPESLPRLWDRLDLERFTAESRFPVQPVVILQDPDAAPGALVRHWPPPEDRVAKHQSYAMQWYGMAVALVAFYAFASFKRKEAS